MLSWEDLGALAPVLHPLFWGAALLLFKKLFPDYRLVGNSRSWGLTQLDPLFVLAGSGFSVLHLWRLDGEVSLFGPGGVFVLDSYTHFTAMLILLVAAAGGVRLWWKPGSPACPHAGEKILLVGGLMILLAGALHWSVVLIAAEAGGWLVVGRKDVFKSPTGRDMILVASGVSLTAGITGLLLLSGHTALVRTGNLLGEEAAGRSGVTVCLLLILSGLALKLLPAWLALAAGLHPQRILYSGLVLTIGLIGALFRIFYGALANMREFYFWGTFAVSLLLILAAGLAALRTRSFEGLLAYTSLSHCGFILIGLTLATDYAVVAALAYLFVFVWSTLGWGILSDVSDSPTISLSPGRRRLLTTLGITYMLVLSGVPPFGIFFARWWLGDAVWNSLVRVGESNLWAVLILSAGAGLGLVLALVLYYRWTRMLLQDNATWSGSFSRPAVAAGMLLAVPPILTGLFSSRLLAAAQKATLPLG